MNIIPFLRGGAQPGATSVRRARCFRRVASRGELDVFSVLGTLGLFATVGVLGLFRTLGEFGVRGPFGVFPAFGLLSAVGVFRPFGVFGSIGALGAIGLLGVPNAFGRFAVYSARSACLVRLVRLARLARSVRWVYFGRSPYSVCPVCIDGCLVLLPMLLSALTLPWVSMLAPRQFLPAVLILACALMFLFVLVACGYVFLDREVASERNSRMFTFFIKTKSA